MAEHEKLAPATAEKVCPRCGQAKHGQQFGKDASRQDGLKAYCKLCDREYMAAWYEARYGSKHPLKKLKTRTVHERFVGSYKVEAAGCWLWQGRPQGSNGYGRFKVSGIQMQAHRYAYESLVSPIPAGLLVLHRCDTPLCVNPDHLFLGTTQDNSDDKVRKGRQARGRELSIAQRKGKEHAREV